MQDLTTAQFNGLKILSKNLSINQVSIDILRSGLLRVTVISADSANFNYIDALLENVFPGKKYRGSVGEDENGDYYMIDVEGETLINLLMKKSPAKAEWTTEEILRREG